MLPCKPKTKASLSMPKIVCASCQASFSIPKGNHAGDSFEDLLLVYEERRKKLSGANLFSSKKTPGTFPCVSRGHKRLSVDVDPEGGGRRSGSIPHGYHPPSLGQPIVQAGIDLVCHWPM